MFEQRKKPTDTAEGQEKDILPVVPPVAPPKAEIEATSLPQNLTQTFTGTLGKAQIHLTLRRTNNVVTGHYLAGGERVELSGTVSADGTALEMQATAKQATAKQGKGGQLTLRLRGNALHGVWQPANKSSKAYGVHLRGLQPLAPTQAGKAAAPAPPAPPQARAQKSNQKASGPLTLTGKLGRAAVKMTLNIQGAQVSGSYSYPNKKGGDAVALSGTLDQAGQLTLRAGAETFEGVLAPNQAGFSGTFSAEGKTQKVELRGDSPAESEAAQVGIKGRSTG